jgi:hypothetical protein
VSGHGKTFLAAHFSLISIGVKQWTKELGHEMNTTKDLMACLNEMFSRWKTLSLKRKTKLRPKTQLKKVNNIFTFDWSWEIISLDNPPL